MFDQLSSTEQQAIINYGNRNGLDTSNPDVLDIMAVEYYELMDTNLVYSTPNVYFEGEVVSSSMVVFQTQNQIIDLMYRNTMSNLKEYGYNLVKVSRNSKASPLCIKAQGKVYWVEEEVRGYEELDANTYQGSGSSNKLFHPNCRHNMVVYFEGESDPPLGSDVERGSQNYQEDQQKKYVERNKKLWYDRKERARVTGDPKQEYYTRKWKEWAKR